MYASKLIKDGEIQKALSLYVKHGAPSNVENHNIYKRLAHELFFMKVRMSRWFAHLGI